MHQIIKKRQLNASVMLMEIEAPFVANKARAGQFVILRIDETGERIPLTIADTHKETGTITIMFQEMGATTMKLARKSIGDDILDVAGPLGLPTELAGAKKACVIGGGVGCAIAYPQAKALFAAGAQVDIIAGFRSKDIVFLEEELRAVSSQLFITTDDGSYGAKGLVTTKLKSLIDGGSDYDLVVTVGPVPMMKYVALTTKPYGIKTLASLNAIMIDGTGMCGCCRVTVDGKTRFACVEGPDFDAHLVDFDQLMMRNTVYKAEEEEAAHRCKIGLDGGHHNA